MNAALIWRSGKYDQSERPLIPLFGLITCLSMSHPTLSRGGVVSGGMPLLRGQMVAGVWTVVLPTWKPRTVCSVADSSKSCVTLVCTLHFSHTFIWWMHIWGRYTMWTCFGLCVLLIGRSVFFPSLDTSLPLFFLWSYVCNGVLWTVHYRLVFFWLLEFGVHGVSGVWLCRVSCWARKGVGCIITLICPAFIALHGQFIFLGGGYSRRTQIRDLWWMKRITWSFGAAKNIWLDGMDGFGFIPPLF